MFRPCMCKLVSSALVSSEKLSMLSRVNVFFQKRMLQNLSCFQVAAKDTGIQLANGIENTIFGYLYDMNMIHHFDVRHFSVSQKNYRWKKIPRKLSGSKLALRLHLFILIQ